MDTDRLIESKIKKILEKDELTEEDFFYAGLNLIYSIFRKDKYSTTDYVELTNAFIEVDDRLIKYYYFVV